MRAPRQASYANSTQLATERVRDYGIVHLVNSIGFVLAGVTAALHVGKLPPALPVLREALGVTLLQAGFLLSLVQLAGMTCGLLVGLAADGLGLSRPTSKSMCPRGKRR